MNEAPLLLALTAGMVGALNPCGFALLPAYVAFFVTGDGPARGLDRRLTRAVTSAIAVTSGFVVAFVALGFGLGSLTAGVQGKLPWITLVIGAALVAGGAMTILGRSMPLPTLALRATKGRGPAAMVGYGVVYALASLSCTIGPFLAISTAALSQSMANGLATYAAYGLGMGVIILAIAFSAALARPGVAGRFHSLSRHVPKIGGAMMIASGLYAVWYARWELAVYQGEAGSDGLIGTGERWRLAVVGWFERVGPLEIAVSIIGVVAFAIAAAQFRAERRAAAEVSVDGTDR